MLLPLLRVSEPWHHRLIYCILAKTYFCQAFFLNSNPLNLLMHKILCFPVCQHHQELEGRELVLTDPLKLKRHKRRTNRGGQVQPPSPFKTEQRAWIGLLSWGKIIWSSLGNMNEAQKCFLRIFNFLPKWIYEYSFLKETRSLAMKSMYYYGK